MRCNRSIPAALRTASMMTVTPTSERKPKTAFRREMLVSSGIIRERFIRHSKIHRLIGWSSVTGREPDFQPPLGPRVGPSRHHAHGFYQWRGAPGTQRYRSNACHCAVLDSLPRSRGPLCVHAQCRSGLVMPLAMTSFHPFERLVITDAVLLTEQVPHVVDVSNLILNKAAAEPPQFMVPEFRGHEAFRRGLDNHEVMAAEDFHECDIERFANLCLLKMGDGLQG